MFCATVNPQEVNRDQTGSRRFVYLHVDSIDKDFLFDSMTPTWCCQLWRQVYEQDYLKLGADAFRLDDDEHRYSEKHNEAFRVSLPFETELLDLLKWDSLNPDDWEWLTATQVKEKCGLKCKSSIIGKALQVICKNYTFSGTRHLHGSKQYFVPDLWKHRTYNQ